MTKIENHQYTIEEAFRECFYIVPDYQREYVWTEKEVQQLLEDINEQLDGPNRQYFIGTVLVSPTGAKNHFEVIDGQQRLTTLFLLLCALRRRLKGDKHDALLGGLIMASYTDRAGETITSLKLDPRYENADIVVSTIAGGADPLGARRAVQTRGTKIVGSVENLLDAYSTLDTYLIDNFRDDKALKAYWGYLANNVVFIQIATDISSALKIFETINERGIGLNPMDLLKNLLFTHVALQQFSELKGRWKKVTGPLEQRREKPLRFLRYFLMANYTITNSRGDAVVREDEIYDWLTLTENARACGYEDDPFGFVSTIAGQVESYLAFIGGRSNDGQQSAAMANLRQLTGGAFSLHYVLLLAVRDLPVALFDHFVRQLESFLFYYLYTKTPTKALERNFSAWADELRAIVEEHDQVARVERLNAFVRERFEKGMTAKAAELRDALRRYNLYSMQRYRTHYLLAKLTQHADMAYRGSREPQSLAEYKDAEIEHILPNTPKEELRSSFGPDRYDEFKNRLGNLTLLEKPINVVAGNKFFSLKLSEYRKCKYYLTSSIAELTTVGKNSSINRMNKKLRAFSDWTPQAIETRQDMLIAMVEDIWRIEDAPLPVTAKASLR